MSQLNINSRVALMRALRQPGLQIRVIEHWQVHLSGTCRSPSKIQTNGYYFDGLDRAGKRTRMWAEVPSAKELRFNEDGTVTFHPNTEKSWTLTFEIDQPASAIAR